MESAEGNKVGTGYTQQGACSGSAYRVKLKSGKAEAMAKATAPVEQQAPSANTVTQRPHGDQQSSFQEGKDIR